MRKWTVRAARAALVAAAITAAGTGIANADDSVNGNGGLIGATQVHAPISIPVSALDVGNQVTGGSALSGSWLPGSRVAYKDNDTNGPALTGGWHQGSAPLIICGNALSTAHGIGTATCKGRANVADDNTAQAAPAAPMAGFTKPEVPVGAPASVGAPGVPAAPAAAPAADLSASSKVPAVNDQAKVPAVNDQAQAPAANDQAQAPAANNQAQALARPVNICGNAGALGGVATAACDGTASSGRMFGHRADLLPAYSASLSG
jgi:hypothetical protein